MREIIYGYDTPTVADCFSRSGPEQIGFELLYACNLRCEYCYLGDGKDRSRGTIKLSEAKKILKHLHESGVISMQFFGGEPTLHPHLLELVQYAREIGLPDVGVQTNGSCQNEELLERLSQSADWIHVTFRGRGEIFDKHAGSEGAYDSAVRSLEILNQGPVFIGLEYDCCPDNYMQIEGLLEHLITDRGLKIRELWLHRIAPRGAATHQSLQSDIAIFTEVLEQCRRMEDRFGIQAKMEDSLPPCLFRDELHPFILPCKGGYVSAYVDPAGNVRRCACSRHSIGNLFEQSLEQMWKESALMKSFRSLSWLPESCRNCAILDQCRGGCSVSAQCSSDHSPDVFSHLFKPRLKPGNKPVS